MKDVSELSSGDKVFKEIFETTEYNNVLYTTTDSTDLIPRFCSKLNIRDFSIQKEMHRIQHECETYLSCVTPKSATAGIIYYVTNRLYKNLKYF